MSEYPTPVSAQSHVPNETLWTPDPSTRFDLPTQTDTAETLAAQWLLWHRDVRHSSPHTLEQYNKVMRFWLSWCRRHQIEPLACSLLDLEEFVTRVHGNGKKGSPSTQASDATALRGWYKWMLDRKLIYNNPAQDLGHPPVIKGAGKPIEDDHWLALWDRAPTDRMKLTLGFGFFCGLRMGEIYGLTCDHVGSHRINNFRRKGGVEDTTPWRAMVELHEKRLPHLIPGGVHGFERLVHRVRFGADSSGTIYPYAGKKQMNKLFSKWCTELGLPHYTPHQMRHSTATNLLRMGVPAHLVMRLMCHSSMDITMGYVRAGAGELREWLDSVD